MTREEIRAKFLGPSRSVPFTHGGAAMRLRVPKASDVEKAFAMKSARARTSYLAYVCLVTEDLSPVFESFEEVMGLDAERGKVADAAFDELLKMLGLDKPNEPKS